MEKNIEQMTYSEIWDLAKDELTFLEPPVRAILKDSFTYLFLVI